MNSTLLNKSAFVLVVLYFMLSHVNAQYYSSGADPFSTDWWQIKTENYQIIFPREYESQAQVFAAKMDYAYDYVMKSMQGKPRKLSIIIHTQTANSNGMVAWVPRRMELWTIPSQDAFNYSQEWMEQLIIHETRHFVQENKMNQGFTKVLKVILGEQAEMIPLGMMTRQWFMEGDAVVAETALSHSGRGRMPSFEQGLRAVTLEKGKQGYDVAHLGTYRHNMPNHYEVGYHTTAVNRLYKDKDMFDNKMDDIGRFATLRGLRDSRKIKYYGFAIDHLEKEWRAQDEKLEKTPYKTIVASDDDYSSFAFLQEADGKLYAVRNSLSKIPEIVEIDTSGVHKVVALTGWKAEPDFSVRKGKLVFADQLPDIRWEQRSYADLFVVDLKTKEAKRITHKQVLQSPSFNSDASQIVAQWVDGNGAYVLQVLNADNGQILHQASNPKNQFYFSPKWSEDDTKIVFVAQETDKKSLKFYDIVKKEEVLLVEGTYGEMSHPFWSGDKVYFTGSYSGINNIYSCDVNTKEVVRMTSARFGADYATILGEELYYSNFTSDGYRPVKHQESSVAGESLSEVQSVSLGLGDKLTEQEGEVIDFSQAPMKKYEVKNYSRLAHLFHIHSWFPSISVDGDDGNASTAETDGLYPGITLLSQNKLSTSFLTASYNGNPASSAEKFKIDYSYNGFYPQLGLTASWGDFDYSPEDLSATYKVNRFVLRPSVTLPLSSKKGVYSLYWSNQFFGEYARRNIKELDYQDDYFTRGFSTNFIRSKQGAVRDLYSPMRQQLSFYVNYADVYDSPYKLASYARFNFPGIWDNNSLKLGLNWQTKDIESTNALGALPRGYTSSDNTDVAYASVDYFLPIGYPDLHLGSLFNIKRWSLGLYGDVAQITDVYGEQEWIGGGGSLFFDTNFLRYEVDVRLGVQAGIAAYSAYTELDYPVNFILNFSIF